MNTAIRELMLKIKDNFFNLSLVARFFSKTLKISMLGIYIRYNAVRARKARGKKEINRNHVDGIANKLSNLYICANKKTNLLKSDTFTHAMIYLIYIPRYFRGRKIILPIALT